MRYSFRRLLAALFGVGSLAAGPTLAAAQDTEAAPIPAPAPPADPGRLEMRWRERPEGLMRVVMSRRARLGIKVNLQARETDSIGAYVDAVTPSGPAAKAGIRSGDVITRIEGKSVLSARDDNTDRRQSQPGLRLIELAARLEPNDTVAIEFRRGKDRKTVSVVTEDEPEMVWSGQPPPPRMFRFHGPTGDGRMSVGGFMDHWEFPGRPLADLELAPLNPDLGQYFGTSDGVLVISAPKESGLGLKGGDVVQAVDGRKPAGPSHLLRILRSYDKGESCKLDVMRNKKHETITARLDDSVSDH
jgi:membrane-associated protease RseP (regulator of RpoE activity)